MEVIGIPKSVDYSKVQKFIDAPRDKVQKATQEVSSGYSRESVSRTPVVESGHMGRHLDVYA